MQKLKHKGHYIPLTLPGLNQKLSFEIKRLIREKEDGVVKHVSTKASLNGTSTLTFKNKAGKTVTLSYRHDESGNLRFAREKQFAQIESSSIARSVRGSRTIGRTSSISKANKKPRSSVPKGVLLERGFLLAFDRLQIDQHFFRVRFRFYILVDLRNLTIGSHQK